MEAPKSSVLRPVVWLGNSKKQLRDFPKGAQKLLGDELQLIQFGGMPKDARRDRMLRHFKLSMLLTPAALPNAIPYGTIVTS